MVTPLPFDHTDVDEVELEALVGWRTLAASDWGATTADPSGLGYRAT